MARLTDDEVTQVAGFAPYSPMSLSHCARLFSLALGRTVTVEEAKDAAQRWNARIPNPPGSTYGELTRRVW